VLSEYKATPLTSAIFRKIYLCHSRKKGEASEAFARKAEGGEMTYLYTSSIYSKYIIKKKDHFKIHLSTSPSITNADIKMACDQQ